MSSMLRVEFATVLFASTFAMSCSDADGGAPGFGGETVGVSAEASGVQEDDGDASSETGPLLDLGGDTTATEGTGSDEECEKIDLLFVIDNSKSMETEQAFLQEAFPAFVSAIEGVLPAATDFHVGVTTTDSNGLVPGTFNQQPNFSEDSCVTTLGALVTRATPDGGNTAYGEGCGFASNQGFMTNTENLAAEFACAAEVGIYGYTGEAHAGALVAALSGELNGAGGCNEGFLRDDALLVTIIISDEDDSESLPDTDDAARVEGWFLCGVSRAGTTLR